jgi:predicted TIM-barrel fold metal-dependent hydrolase
MLVRKGIQLLKILVVASILSVAPQLAIAKEKLVDVHIHYSHDAWEMLPPKDAIKVLQAAGLQKAFVSSSSDDGTQMLYKAAPELIVPVLRPYRRRGELGTWFRDETVIDLLEDRLAKNTYAGIGEFHIFGENADLPVIRRVVELADEYKIFLHAHSDAEAIDKMFAQNPNARILWAHSGFDSPSKIAAMLSKYPNLTADLAFRSDHANDGKVDPDWKNLFLEFPDRIMLGTDTYTPERWYFVEDNADWTREWLTDLPSEVAAKIARENAISLSNWALKK